MQAPDSDHVRVDTDGRRAEVVITRGEKSNSLSHEAVVDLREAVEAVDDADGVRAASTWR